MSPWRDKLARIITTCTFSNETDQAITFGENVGNELCFNFAMYEPKDGSNCDSGGLFPGGEMFPLGRR